MTTNLRLLCCIGILAVYAAGCGQQAADTPAASTPSTAPPTDTASTSAAATASIPLPEGGVTLSGVVTGPPPADAPKPLRMSADSYCTGRHSDPVFSQGSIVGAAGQIAWAFVYVKAGLDAYAFPTPEDAVKLDQYGCMYEPHVFGVQTDQTIEIRNSDRTLHNVHAVPAGPNKPFNIAHPPVGTMIHRRSFAKPEIMVKIKCDVHPWMKAYTGVLEHPFFAVTDADGRYAIANLPPGTYTIGIWHERLGEIEREIVIPTKGTPTLDVAFPSS